MYCSMIVKIVQALKFKDADLIGYPLRITVSKNTLENNEVEIQIRKTGEALSCAIDSVATKSNRITSKLIIKIAILVECSLGSQFFFLNLN